MQQIIKEGLEVLNKGGIILFPSDVDWAIGCDATNEKAISQLSKLVNKKDSDTFCILLDNAGKIQGYVDEMSDVAWDLMEMSENPMTIILGGLKNLPDTLLNSEKCVGMRVTAQEFSRNLCTRLRRPLVCWSTGAGSLTEVPTAIKNSVDFIVDYQTGTKKNHESIIKLGKGNLFQIIRQ